MGDHYEKFQDVKDKLSTKRKPPSLLLGNGFSIAYDKDIFSYNSLSDYITDQDDELLTKLFEVANTKNFEQIMEQLRIFSELCAAFGDDRLPEKIMAASEAMKNGLIAAIDAMHPNNVFNIPDDQSHQCATFLNYFLEPGGQIFTTNYDLLLYWVLMRNSIQNHIDGFGRDLENEEDLIRGEAGQWSELRWGNNKSGQNVHYVHGAMHLFDDGIDVIKEEYDSGAYLTDKIKRRLSNKEYPIFVAAGNGQEKLKHINHNRYLSHCFEKLSQVSESLVTFGFSFGESDDHIIHALNEAARQEHGQRLYSIYVGVYSDKSRRFIESISSKFKCKVNTFDAKTTPVWFPETA